MTGTGNPHKEAAQRAKADAVKDAALRIYQVGLDDAVSLGVLAELLEVCDDARYRPIFEAARVRPHSAKTVCSDEVRALVVKRINDLADLARTPVADPFAGLPR